MGGDGWSILGLGEVGGAQTGQPGGQGAGLGEEGQEAIPLGRGGVDVGHAGPNLVHPELGEEQDHPVGLGGVGGEGAAGGQEVGAQILGVGGLGRMCNVVTTMKI